MLEKLKSLHFKIDFFALGLLFIPFDNLFFAPSVGWATIAPFFFCAYILQNIKQIKKIIDKEKKFIIILFVFAIYQAILIFINGLHIRTLIDSIGTFGLGLSFFFSLVVRYEIRNEVLMNADGKKLFIAYICSFIYGVIRLFAMNFSESLLNVFTFIEKRTCSRLSFSFTEPSFTSIHIIGVLFLFSYLVSDKKLAKRMLILGISFFTLQIVASGSARALVDVLVLIALFVVRWGVKNPKRIVLNSVILILGVLLATIVVISSTRVQNALSQGFYGDNSLASRFIMINSMCQGFLNEPIKALLGYGMGNMIIPFKSGYPVAISHFKSNYDPTVLPHANAVVNEVSWFYNASEIDSVYCFYAKLIADVGLLLFVLGFLYTIKKFIDKKLDVFVLLMVLWIYIQFDSYAFYALWLILFLCKYYDKDKYGGSFMGVFVGNEIEKSEAGFVVKFKKLREKAIRLLRI